MNFSSIVNFNCTEINFREMEKGISLFSLKDFPLMTDLIERPRNYYSCATCVCGVSHNEEPKRIKLGFCG